MKNYKIALVILALLSYSYLQAAGKPDIKQFVNCKKWSFEKNKGQLGKESGKVKYYGRQHSVNVYCLPGKISFVFTKVENKNIGNTSEATGMLSPAGEPVPIFREGMGWKNPVSKLLTSKISSSVSLPGITLTTARVDLILVNANPSARIIASGHQNYYENFYTSNKGDSGITNVPNYNTMTYKNIYPHIDFIIHTKRQRDGIRLPGTPGRQNK